ncbi:thioredoxin-like protein [Massariosphaeria phaeospora]|uniref:Thioredoxin-like protein n=1 Tax=Massariosphaeria phaeospora TaxID=100035 RepID=A0A7C8IAJ8_9PLEO|nr:thioredoxin-like protein [Massariosphaeria phaeospora]
MASLQDITDESAFRSTVSSLPASTLAIIYFYAPWAAPCKQVSLVLSALASTYAADAPVCFLSLDADELCDVAEEYDVISVPFIVLQKDGKTLETVSGADASNVRAAVEKYVGAGSDDGAKSSLPPAQSVTKPPHEHIQETADGNTNSTKDLSSYAPSASDPNTAPEYSSSTKGGHEAGASDAAPEDKEELFKRLGELVKAAPVMLFLKGTPNAPQCGFSKKTVGLLREHRIRYGFFNILADDGVRQGMKEFAEWPTFPQLWVDGDLVGGLDIVKEEFENDEDFLEQYRVKPAKSGQDVAAPSA